MINDNIIERKFHYLFIIWFIILLGYDKHLFNACLHDGNKNISQRKWIQIHTYNVHSDKVKKYMIFPKSQIMRDGIFNICNIPSWSSKNVHIIQENRS